MPPLLRAAWRFFLFLHLLTITYSHLALFLSHAKIDKPFTPVCVQFLLHVTCMKPLCHPLNYVMHFSFVSLVLEQPTTRHGRLSQHPETCMHDMVACPRWCTLFLCKATPPTQLFLLFFTQLRLFPFRFCLSRQQPWSFCT